MDAKYIYFYCVLAIFTFCKTHFCIVHVQLWCTRPGCSLCSWIIPLAEKNCKSKKKKKNTRIESSNSYLLSPCSPYERVFKAVDQVDFLKPFASTDRERERERAVRLLTGTQPRSLSGWWVGVERRPILADSFSISLTDEQRGGELQGRLSL